MHPAVPTPEQQALDALHHFKEVLTDMGELRESLELLQRAGFSQTPNCRSLKIQQQIRDNSVFPARCVPSLTLTGNWLYNAGFDYEQRVQVITMKNLIIICPDSKVGGKTRRGA